MKSPVRWFGGKAQMAGMIAELLPDHRIYVEVFGGGASLLFTKKTSPVEVYNDLNSGLVNFFRVLRDPIAAAQLYFLTSRTPYSREEFERSRDAWRSETDPVRKAHLWYVTMSMGYGGQMTPNNGWSRSRTSGREMSLQVRRWLGTNERLAFAQERLMRVQIEQQDFRRVMLDYDTSDTVFYVDPPYAHDTRRGGGYEIELNDEDHGDLVEILLGLKGQAILSGYETPLYKPLIRAGWKLQKHARLCTTGQNTRGIKLDHKKGARVECLWTSPGIGRKRSRRAKPCLRRAPHAVVRRRPHYRHPTRRELAACLV